MIYPIGLRHNNSNIIQDVALIYDENNENILTDVYVYLLDILCVTFVLNNAVNICNQYTEH